MQPAPLLQGPLTSPPARQVLGRMKMLGALLVLVVFGLLLAFGACLVMGERAGAALPQEAPGSPQEEGTALVAPGVPQEAPPSAGTSTGALWASPPDPAPWKAPDILTDPGVGGEQDDREGLLGRTIQGWTLGAWSVRQDVVDEALESGDPALLEREEAKLEAWLAEVDAAVEREAPRLAQLPQVQGLQDEIVYWNQQGYVQGLHVGHLLTAPKCTERCAPPDDPERVRLESLRKAALERLRLTVAELTMESVLRDALEGR